MTVVYLKVFFLNIYVLHMYFILYTIYFYYYIFIMTKYKKIIQQCQS